MIKFKKVSYQPVLFFNSSIKSINFFKKALGFYVSFRNTSNILDIFAYDIFLKLVLHTSVNQFVMYCRE